MTVALSSLVRTVRTFEWNWQFEEFLNSARRAGLSPLAGHSAFRDPNGHVWTVHHADGVVCDVEIGIEEIPIDPAGERCPGAKFTGVLYNIGSMIGAPLFVENAADQSLAGMHDTVRWAYWLIPNARMILHERETCSLKARQLTLIFKP